MTKQATDEEIKNTQKLIDAGLLTRGMGEALQPFLERIKFEKDRADKAEADYRAVKALMDCHNMGGWTDAVGPMKRALAAEEDARTQARKRDDVLEELRLTSVENNKLTAQLDAEKAAALNYCKEAITLRNKIIELEADRDSWCDQADMHASQLLRIAKENEELKEGLRDEAYAKYLADKEVTKARKDLQWLFLAISDKTLHLYKFKSGVICDRVIVQ